MKLQKLYKDNLFHNIIKPKEIIVIKMNNKKVCIVVPCYNEAKRIDINYFRKLSKIPNTEWIFVDDGSTDSTLKVLHKLGDRNNISSIRLKSNVGKSKAIAQGILQIFNNINDIGWIGFLDADGAFTISDIQNFVQMTQSLKYYDAIYSSRVKMAGRNIHRNNKRHITARIITTFFGMNWTDIPYDTQSGFKLYRYTPRLKLLFIENFRTKWFFDIELHLRYMNLKASTFSVWEEPVTTWIDIPGSKINFREGFRIFTEICYITNLLYSQRKTSRASYKSKLI
jgi:glycosyltransferase involved in cell wall biosynthesis